MPRKKDWDKLEAQVNKEVFKQPVVLYLEDFCFGDSPLPLKKMKTLNYGIKTKMKLLSAYLRFIHIIVS